MSYSRYLKAAALALLPALAACNEETVAPVAPARDVVFDSRPVTLEWQEQARALVAAHSVNALAGGRVYAAVSVAAHRAIQEVERNIPGEKTGGLPAGGGRSLFEARRGAVAGASARVLKWFFPGASSTIDRMLAEQGSAGPAEVHPHFRRGEALGRAAGEAMIERLQNDGFTQPWTGTVRTGPGSWIPGALPPGGAMLGGVTPYFLTSGAQFRSPPPPTIGSGAFDTDLGEVRTLAQNRTSEQLAFAKYWDFPLGTYNPIGRWNHTTAQYVEQYRLDESAAAHAFALTHAAVFDALIGCWEAKYHYWLLRPTHADPSISLAFTLPNFPSYPSGHSCASAAAARVLTHLFPARAAELDHLVDDAGLSRILAGIHFRFDVTAGQELGRAVADWAITRDAK